MQLTPQQLYSSLVDDHGIIGSRGRVDFTLKELTITVHAKDTIGNLIQEWLMQWMGTQDIVFAHPPNTQDFPDFLLNPDNNRVDLLEVKSFDFSKSANFDVANFLTYRRSLLAHPYRLDSDYLIFGYTMTGPVIEIRNVWKKKVWEITGPSADWPLKCQVKQGEVVNIRPVKWYDSDRTTFKPFGSALAFVEAFDRTQRQWARTQRDAITSTWLTRVISGYRDATGRELV